MRANHPARSSIAAIALVTLMALTACGSGPTPVVGTLPSTSASPTPEATLDPTSTPTASSAPVEEPYDGLAVSRVPGQPEQVFGGACGAVFSLSDLEPILDGPRFSGQANAHNSFPSSFSVRQVGGMECGWADSANEDGFSATVLPAEAVSPRTAAPCRTAEPEYDYADFVCELEATVHGIRLSGRASFLGGTIASARARTADLLSVFTSSAASAPSVPVPAPKVHTWPSPALCSVFDPVLYNEKFMNGASMVVIDGSGGTDVYFSKASVELMGLGSEPARVNCGFDVFGGKITQKERAAGVLSSLAVEMLPGGAWAHHVIEDTFPVTEVVIPGADRALLVNDPDYGKWLAVFDGPNYLSVRLAGPATSYFPSVTILLDVLDGP